MNTRKSQIIVAAALFAAGAWDPVLCLDPLFLPLQQASQLIHLLHQKIRALNVLSIFWQSEILLTNLNAPNALSMLEKHYQQVNDLPKHGSSDGSADNSHPAAPGSNLGVGSYENQLLSVTRIDGYVMSNK